MATELLLNPEPRLNAAWRADFIRSLLLNVRSGRALTALRRQTQNQL